MRSIVLERARTLRHYELGVAAPTAGLVRVALALAPITEGDLDAYYHGTGKLPRVFGRTMIGSVVDAATVDADADDTRIITFVPAGHGRLQPGTPVAVTFDNDEDGALR